MKYLPISYKVSQFYTDCRNGALPAVSTSILVSAVSLPERQNDDHPHGDIRNGEYFLNEIYNAVTTSPNWSSTILIIIFDEWGGVFIALLYL